MYEYMSMYTSWIYISCRDGGQLYKILFVFFFSSIPAKLVPKHKIFQKDLLFNMKDIISKNV
jgi:hypothetical protein